MWLHVPSPPSPSAAASECSTSDSTSRSEFERAWRFGHSSTWRGKALSCSTLWRRWRRGDFRPLLSGLTCDPSHDHPLAISWARRFGDDLWGSSTAASPASPTASPGGAVAQAIEETWSTTLMTRLAATVPNAVWSRTSQGCLPGMEEAGSPVSSRDWKGWITGLRQDYSARLRWARTSAGSGSSCSAWPTVRGEDSECCGNHPGARDSLHAESRDWPTPATDSFRSRGGDRREEQGLDQQGRLWPTPRVPTGGAESAAQKQERGRTESGGGDLRRPRRPSPLRPRTRRPRRMASCCRHSTGSPTRHPPRDC